MGDLGRLVLPLAQVVGQFGKLPGHLLGDLLGSDGNAECLGGMKHILELLVTSRGQERVVGDLIDLLDRVGEVGVDEDALHVGYHQERRIVERLAVLEQLLIGFVEVSLFALVLHREMVFFPHIGPALAALLLAHPSLVGEALAGRVVLGGRGVAHEATEIGEVLLVAGALLDGDPAPFLDELLGCEGGGHRVVSSSLGWIVG